MPTFLIDEPASPDSNEYEVHEAIANAIESEVIGEGGIKGGRRIALIGEWGSGKSTIVRSLSARFKSRELTDEPTVFIVF